MTADPTRTADPAAAVAVLAAGRDGVHAARCGIRSGIADARICGTPAAPAGPTTAKAACRFRIRPAMFAALDPAEIERKIGELKIIEELAHDEPQHDADEHQDDGTAEGVARSDARRRDAPPRPDPPRSAKAER